MEKLWLFSRLLTRARVFLRRLMSGPAYLAMRLNTKTPDRLLIAPQDIRTADRAIAAEIYAGYFALAGKVINTHGRRPFEIVTQEPDFERALNSFGWLRHLRAADSALANANARALVDDFLACSGAPKRGIAWEPKVVARRLLAFLSQSPMILDGADHVFYRRFMRGLTRAQKFLEHELANGLCGEPRLVAAIALAELGLCASDSAALRRKSTKLLAAELAEQILPDGGHISRNPEVLVGLLLDLLPLRQAYAAQSVQPPPQLLNAVDRMLPMLQLLRHGDGTLALFNGMGVTAPDLLATVLAYDDVRAEPLLNAPYSGYQRVEAGAGVLILDTGRPAPPEFSNRAHAGCLAFEFSTGSQKVIINCGAPDALHRYASEAARASAAHSTLIIADTSSCRFARSHGLERFFEGQILAGPRRVAVERQDLPNRTRMRLAHDGYVGRFGLIHERRLTLSNDGLLLDGDDRLRAVSNALPPARPYALRFHIHPAVQLRSGFTDGAVLLTLPDGQRWIFSSTDTPISIEESIFLAAADGARACAQIVLYGDSQKQARLTWSLRRHEDGDADMQSLSEDDTQIAAPEEDAG